METFLDRSRLALAAGLAVFCIIGTSKFVSIPLYQAMHEWETVALCFVIPLAYLALKKFNIK